ncbi:uncharacterized protein V1516DRAFT_672758 [Lipomyces oligophaga]|uniref:uncharacterized protein n=1 Tax=Lipomyces oligophaga TaxID=45792 RepID=UPI0034CDE0EC
MACSFRHEDRNTLQTQTRPKSDLTELELEIEDLLLDYPNSEVETGQIHMAFPPSDPDFPFDLAALEFTLLIPQSYPPSFDLDLSKDAEDQVNYPTIIVTNSDIPRGFCLNIEHGFLDQISKPGVFRKSLVEMIHDLDAQLEEFLKAAKRETIKIVNPIRKPKKSAYDEWGIDANVIAELASPKEESPSEESVIQKYNQEELNKAKVIRDREIKQLLSRLSSLKRDGPPNNHFDTFLVPFTPKNRSSLPECFESVNTVRLLVPILYNLYPCQIQFEISDSVAKAAEQNFKNHAATHSEFSLFSNVNYLMQNFETLAKESELSADTPISDTDHSELEPTKYKSPPEWDQNSEEEEDYDFDYTETDSWFGDISEDDEEDQEESDGEPEPNSSRTVGQDFKPPSSATSINFNGIKLLNIAVMECTELSIVVKCSRCKIEAEIRGIKPNLPGIKNPSAQASSTCAKCSGELAVSSFYADFLHNGPGGARAGYIDLIGCKAFDLLPSSFMPSCGECFENLPGKVGIAGLGLSQTMSTNCQNCHTKLTVYIPEVKFSRVSEDQASTLSRRKVKSNKNRFGIVVGTPLPLNGTCKHYKRSTRWFRFSCCARVFPCDRCHNEYSDHPDEHANRMICGMCSREQNYRPEMCAFCRHSFVRRSTGFWEGGLGTRDKLTMSRKDPRKYKRRTQV